jgi:hypothetical protein
MIFQGRERETGNTTTNRVEFLPQRRVSVERVKIGEEILLFCIKEA